MSNGVLNTRSGSSDVLVNDGVAGTIYDRRKDYYNVQSYGAQGDGVTDDAPAIQRAIDAVSGDGVVFFPEPDNEYLVKSKLSIQSGDVLCGEPNSDGSIGGSTILVDGTFSDNRVIESPSNSNAKIGIFNLTVDGDSVSLEWAIRAWGMRFSRLNNLRLKNIKGGGIRTENVSNTWLTIISDVHIDIVGSPGKFSFRNALTDAVVRNLVSDGGQGAEETWSGGSTYIDCEFKNSNGSGMTIEDIAGPAYNITFADCSFHDNNGYGFKMDFGGDINSPRDANISISGCNYYSNKNADHRINDGKFISFSNCNFQGSDGFSFANTVDYISWYSCEFSQSSVPSPGNNSASAGNSTSVSSFSSSPGVKNYVADSDTNRLRWSYPGHDPDKEYRYLDEYRGRGGDSDALERAVDDLSSGDVLYIESATFTREVSINTSIDIIGTSGLQDKDNVKTNSFSGDYVLKIESDGVTVSRLDFDVGGYNEACIKDNASSTVFAYCTFFGGDSNEHQIEVTKKDTTIFSTRCSSGANGIDVNADNVDIIGSLISFFDDVGVRIRSGVNGCRVLGCWIESCANANILMENSGGTRDLECKGLYMAQTNDDPARAFKCHASSTSDMSSVIIEGVTLRGFEADVPQIDLDNCDDARFIGWATNADYLFDLNGTCSGIDIHGCVGPDINDDAETGSSSQWNQSANTVW